MSTPIPSAPAYRPDQPTFINAVVLVELAAGVSPRGLLRDLQVIEERHGRDRSKDAVVNGPRSLDLDIIDIEAVLSDDPDLLLPHPLALERDFVIEPLLEIASDYVLADGTPVADFGAAATGDAAAVAGVAGMGGAAAIASAAGIAGAAQGNEGAATQGNNVAQGNERAGARRDAAGALLVCSVPIGNLGDITLRVIKALASADLVLAEDTRVARRLLSHLNLRPPLRRCDENVIRDRSPHIIRQLEEGKRIAYLADAGTPGVADPGMYLVAATRAAGIAVEVLPGASAVLTALVAAGFTADGFYFGGFLPRKEARRRALLEALAGSPRVSDPSGAEAKATGSACPGAFAALDAVLVFYESPHRVAASLKTVAEVFPQREVALCRELTKLHEEVLRAPAPQLAAQIAARASAGDSAIATNHASSSAAQHPLKGEIVLVIGPPPRRQGKREHRDRYARQN
jgi:16S rRNA (cytidine1402-2'-O)-methyltransferase